MDGETVSTLIQAIDSVVALLIAYKWIQREMTTNNILLDKLMDMIDPTPLSKERSKSES